MMQNWHRSFSDVIAEAHMRAALTRRRYQVYFEPNNRWWVLRETQTLLPGHREYRKVAP